MTEEKNFGALGIVCRIDSCSSEIMATRLRGIFSGGEVFSVGCCLTARSILYGK
jgi:hypothetical protein